MAADNREHGGEPEAVAVLLRGEKRIEDPGEVLRRDAAAVVANLEFDVGAGREFGHLLPGEHEIARADLQKRAMGRGRHRLHGIDHEILKNLEHLRPIDQHGIAALGDVQ